MAKTLPLSEVKTRLPELVTGVEEREEEVVVTKNGRPAAVLINVQEYARLGAVDVNRRQRNAGRRDARFRVGHRQAGPAGQVRHRRRAVAAEVAQRDDRRAPPRGTAGAGSGAHSSSSTNVCSLPTCGAIAVTPCWLAYQSMW